jgi:hypothetical protein
MLYSFKNRIKPRWYNYCWSKGNNMDKNHIISEIKRIAEKNNGKAPGSMMFERETGIRKSDWYPEIWLRWSDALLDAGYAPNKFQTAIDNDLIIQSYIGLVRELGKLPVAGEIRRKSKSDRSFPSHNVFNRFGGKEKLIEAVILYCQTHLGNEDIITLCSEYNPSSPEQQKDSRKTSKVSSGFVYLMKSGKHYKIGRTISVGRREREFAIKIPVPPKTIHSIETDDPVGVEAYWHDRFKDKRGEGEWFDLSSDDISAFKRWKRIF